MTRRQFFKTLGLGGVGATTGWSAYHLGWERYSLKVERRVLEVPGLPPQLEGLTVAHLSDFHAGRYTPWALTERAVAAAVDAAADLLLLTGDYLSMGRGEGRVALELALRPARARHGVWAVLGNHDCILDRHAIVVKALAAAGATVLNNAARAIHLRGVHVWMVGLDDPVTGRADFSKAMAAVAPEAFVMLLAHTPDVIAAAADLGINVVFAGHTHGGQVVIPLFGPPLVPSRYGSRFASGSFLVGRTAMHVTRGVGMVPPLVRFCCPPEVAIITLTAARL